MTREHFISDLAQILSDFQGREYTDTIDGDTLFLSHLGLSSIDVVILGETLESKYETKLPFGKFLSELGQNNVEDLKIGELADFLNQHVTK